MNKLATAAFLGTAAASALASASNIGVQFYQSGYGANAPALTSGQYAGVVPQDDYNAIDTAFTNNPTAALYDDSGSGSPVATLTTSANDNVYFSYTEYTAYAGTPNAALLSTKLGDYGYGPVNGGYSYVPPTSFAISGLTGSAYDLYVYNSTNITGLEFEVSIATGTTSGPTAYFDRNSTVKITLGRSSKAPTPPKLPAIPRQTIWNLHPYRRSAVPSRLICPKSPAPKVAAKVSPASS